VKKDKREHPILAKIKTGAGLDNFRHSHYPLPITHYQKAFNFWFYSKLGCTQIVFSS
jgi:hypothetical protein